MFVSHAEEVSNPFEAYAVGSSERLGERESRSKNASLSNTFSTSSSPVSDSIVDISRGWHRDLVVSESWTLLPTD